MKFHYYVMKWLEEDTLVVKTCSPLTDLTKTLINICVDVDSILICNIL